MTQGHPDALSSQLLAHCAGESVEATLGGGVEGHHRHVVEGDLRRDVHDVAAAGRAQQRNGCARGVDGSHQVGVDRDGDVFVAGFFDQPNPAGTLRS